MRIFKVVRRIPGRERRGSAAGHTASTAGLETRGKTLVSGSDAHYPDDVGTRVCRLEMDVRDFEGVKAALAQGKVDR